MSVKEIRGSIITSGGDVAGADAGTTIVGIQGMPVSSTLPSDSQLLQFIGADGKWEPEYPDLVIGFVMSSGATGTNVGPMLAAPHAGIVSKCCVVTKASDAAIDLTFKIKKNGTDVFSTDPTVTHGTAAGTVNIFTALTATPLTVVAGDVFSIDITSGASAWQFTAQMET
jgi:hypothetical protein